MAEDFRDYEILRHFKSRSQAPNPWRQVDTGSRAQMKIQASASFSERDDNALRFNYIGTSPMQGDQGRMCARANAHNILSETFDGENY